MLRWDSTRNQLIIQDLNPERKIVWLFGRREMLDLAWAALKAALRGK